MGKKRGEVEEWLRRIMFGGKKQEYIVFIRHRIDSEEVMRPIPGEILVDVRGGYMYTSSGEQIPLHRVVEVRSKKGDVLYRRG